MTAEAMAGDRERFLAAGMNDYVSNLNKSNEILADIDSAADAALKSPQLAPIVDELKQFKQRWDGLDEPTIVYVEACEEHAVSICRYLHGQDPPVIHRDINPKNVMLPAFMVKAIAKITQAARAHHDIRERRRSVALPADDTSG